MTETEDIERWRTTHTFSGASCGIHIYSWILAYYIVVSAILAVMKTCGFGPFSQFYEILHTVLGSVDSFEGISGIPQISWIWSFLAVI